MSSDISQLKLTIVVPQNLDNYRLDLALSTLLPEYSRARIQEWIKAGYVAVDEKKIRSKDKVFISQTIDIQAEIATITKLQAQSIALNIIYEDQDIIIVNKPAGLVTHPGAGNEDHTLLNALLYRYPELSTLPRAGIIHRLDKDTSGVMVVTRNLVSHHKLVADLQKREIKREYEAIIRGTLLTGGTVDAPIGRHQSKRTHMAVRSSGKPAVTHYRIIKRFSHHTHLRVMLETGRTHQIRVHLSHIGYPIVGDPTYGNSNKMSEKLPIELRDKLDSYKRQALHAKRLELRHPSSNKIMSWETQPPQDFQELLAALERYNIP